MSYYRFSVLLLFLLVKFSLSCFSQQPLIHKKGAFIDTLNRYYQQAELPVYLFISNSLDEQPKPLKEERSDSIRPIFLDGPGVHVLRHSDDFHKRSDLFKIYADGHAPATSLVRSAAPAYKSKSGKQYYGKGYSITLTAKDDMSGVGNIYLSMNGAAYGISDVRVKFEKEGAYKLSYYAVDKVGNVEHPQSHEFEIDITPPKTYYSIVGIATGNILSVASNIRLKTDNDSSGVAKIYYTFNQESPKLYNGKEVPLTSLETGLHTLYYWSVDNVENEEEKQSFEFFLDKVSPIASIDVLGDKFIVDNKIYLSGRTKIKITAVDNRTGIKELKYSINNAIFQDYTEPFYMPSKAGVYTIQYFVADELNNRNTGEMLQSKGVIYVDLLGPSLDYKLEGPVFKKKDEIYVGPKTEFQIIGKDAESGLKSLYYTVNGSGEKIYTSPFLIGTTSGKYAIDYIAYDNVNNRNQRSVSLNLDAEGPVMNIRYSTESEVLSGTDRNVYPSYTVIYIAATDAQTTCSAIYYSIDGGKEQMYTGPLKGFEPNKKYKIWVRAQDAVGNETIKEIEFETTDF